MKLPVYPADRRGNTLIEVLAAVFLFAIIGILGTRIILSSTKASLHSQKIGKSTTLANMVFDHYAAAVVQNFSSLPAYDHLDPVRPKVFFSANTDFGYDAYTLTTQTTFSDDRSRADVQVTTYWRENGRGQEAHYSRSYTERVGRASGGVLQVLVTACETCPGLPGFDVLAEPMLADDEWVTRTTDNDGKVLLTGVRVGDTTRIRVKHAITRFDRDPADGGVQGYVFTLPDGTLSDTQEITQTVAANVVNSVHVFGFRALGRITGTLRNMAPDLGDGLGTPVAGMQVALWGVSVADGASGFKACTELEPCTVQSKAISATRGEFNFYGVIPGNVTVMVDGMAGSEPPVQRSDPAFRWGYTGGEIHYPGVLAWSTDGSIPTASMDGALVMPHVYRMGWLELRTTDNSSAPIAATVDCFIHQDTWHRYYEWRTIPTDAGGIGRLYNAIARRDGVDYKCEAYRDPQGGDHGLYAQVTVPACTSVPDCMSGGRLVNLAMTPGSQITGTLRDESGTLMSGATVRVFGVGIDYPTVYLHRSLVSNVTGPDGQFTINGYFASMHEAAGAWWKIVLAAPKALENITQPIDVFDVDRQMLVPNAPVNFWADYGVVEPYQPDTRFVSDASGHFVLHARLRTPLFINQVPLACPADSVCPFDLTVRENASLMLQSWSPHWFDGPIESAIASANTTLAVKTLSIRLNYHKVVGQVTDPRGRPLQGIRVEDPVTSSTNGTMSALTNADGRYELNVRVTGRTPASAGNAQIFIPNGQMDSTGTAYNGAATRTLALTDTSDPDGQPFIVNFALEGGQEAGTL